VLSLRELSKKVVPEMAYTVPGGMLNPLTHSRYVTSFAVYQQSPISGELWIIQNTQHKKQSG